MTVSTAYAPISYSGNGATTSFSVTWPFFTGSLVVTIVSSTGVETLKALTSDYTVTGGTDANGLPSTGTVVMVTAPAVGQTLRIQRSTPKTQATTWGENDAFPQKVVESALDKLLLIAQEGSGGGDAFDDVTGDTIQLNTAGATDYWDGENHILRNLANGQASSDAVTVEQLNAAQIAGANLTGGPSGYALIGNGASTPTWQGFTQSGTGASTRTWSDKVRELISVDDFGAVGDGTTVDTAAFTAAFTALGTTGGTVWLGRSKKYRIGSITIPANVCLRGHVSGLDSTTDNITFTFQNMGSTLLLDASSSVTLSTGAAITNCVIRPYGLSLSQSSSAAWAGDAILSTTGLGCAIVGNIILGFNRAIYLSGVSRARIEFNAIDCNNGIDITGSYDSTRILNNHCWPYLTHTAFWNSGANYAARDKTMLYRTGSGIYLHDGTDDTHVDGNLVYGYLIGLRAYNAGALNWGRNWVDHPFGVNRTNNFGVVFEGTVDNFTAQTIFIWGVKVGLYAGSTGTIAIDLVHAELIDEAAVYLDSGNIRIGHLDAHSATRAVTITHATNVTLDLDSYDFRSITASEAIEVPSGATTENIYIGQGTSDEADGTALVGVNNLLFPSVASGSSVSIPAHGTWFNVTGTTTINNIGGGYGSQRIVLRFASAGCSVSASGGNITLDQTFTSNVVGATLELYYDGHSSTWREISRSGDYTTFGTWRAASAPAVTASSGTYTSAAATLSYRQIGKTVEFRLAVTITTNGTAAGTTLVALPWTAQGTQAIAGVETASTGNGLSCYVGTGTTTLIIRRASDGSYAGADGYGFIVSGVMETT